MKAGGIQIGLKREPKDLSVGELLPLVPYRVVNVRADFNDVEVGDVVMRFPCRTGGHFILNCTRQMMLFDKSSHNGTWSDFHCRRAHDVEQIVFAYDDEVKP